MAATEDAILANFLIVSDPDSNRRDEYLEQIEGQIAPLSGLVVGRVEHAGIGVRWAASPRAPVSVAETESSVAVVWGMAYRRHDDRAVDARALGARSPHAAGDVLEPLDGYHAAVVYRDSAGLAISADLLGLFPIYYAAIDNVLVAGTSPELLRQYPGFSARLDHEGLIGLLMTHGLLGGRTLIAGVRRLQPGHVLRRAPGGPAAECIQYRIPDPSALSEQPFEEQVDALGNAVEGAVGRYASHRSSIGLLLSGGRDTRLLGGFLREAGCTIDAVTFGQESDYEVRCARAVGRALGATHRVTSVPEDAFVHGADSQAKWGQLGSGFSTVHTWGMIKELTLHESPIVSGYLVGRIAGGASMISQNGPYGQSISFDTAYPLCAPVSIERTVLRRLLCDDDARDAVQTVLERMRHDYDTTETVETQRPWRYLLYHFERFHAGAVPWHLSFGAWPVVPVLDQRLLATIGGMHPWALANRRAQDALLCRRFPDLARIILDRNAHNIDPLQPTLGYRARRRVRRWVTLTRLLRERPQDGIEPRYYYRMYDLNGPGWRAIRRLAEPHRETLSDLFDVKALREYLPPPEDTIEMRDTIVDGSGRKLLLGLMLWRGRVGI